MTTIFLPDIRRQSPVTLRTTVTYSDDIDLVDVTSHLLSGLADKLRPYVDIEHHFNPLYSCGTYTARISLVPLDTRQCVLNDQYTYNSQYFTRAEIDAAVANTYPERFL